MSKSKLKNNKFQTEIPASISSLYNLIGVLTRSQKRDFKKDTRFWNYSKSGKYLVLFDMINSFINKGKDVESLTAYLIQSAKFGKLSQLTSLARYLLTRILESVRNRQEVSPETNRLLNMIQSINFLFYKGLFGECEQLINDAKKLANNLDKSTYLLELSVWERRLYVTTGRPLKELGKRLREIADEEQVIMQNLQVFFDINTLSNDLFLNIKEGSPISDVTEAKIAGLVAQNEGDLLNNLPLRAKFWYYNSLFHYYENRHKMQKPARESDDKMVNLRLALECLEKIFGLSEGEGKLIASEEPSLFNSFIDNYISLCFRLSEFSRVERFEKKILVSENEIQYYRSSVYHRLSHMLIQNEFRKAGDFVTEIDLFNRLPLFENRIEESRMIVLRYYSGLVFFVLQDFKKASEWYGLILDGARTKSNPMLLISIELQQIVSLFELGAYKKKPSRPLDNFLGKLRRNKKLIDFYSKLIQAMKNVFEPKIPEIPGELESQNELLRNLLKENRIFASYFGPVVAWLEARVNHTTVVSEIVKYQN